MKTIKLLSIFVILIFFISNSTASGLNSVFSKDGINVWAVGTNGYIIYSSNGGAGWANVSIGNTSYNSVYSYGQNVWITGNSGILQLSTDNGNSWNQQTLTNGINFKSVFFINSSTGWIAGDNGTILKSTNSGLNWAAQTPPVSSNLNCVTFIDALNGIICGANGTILITSNGGSNWSASTTNTTKELLSVDMKSGTIIASGANATVIKSTNNGASWNAIDYKIQTKSDVNCVFMMDVNTYYSCGGGGFIRKSTNAGGTFTFQINPMLADLYKIYFYNINTGWACGRDNNIVLRTTDGGNTWQMPANATQSYNWVNTLQIVSISSTGNVFALNNFNKNGIYISAKQSVNDSQKIFRSMNLGINWSTVCTIPIGEMTHGFIISPRDSGKFLVLVDTTAFAPHNNKGRVLRSTNYGLNWVTTFTGNIDPDGSSLEYDANHSDTVYLGATDSLFYCSTDFGLTWLPTGSTILGHICDIAIPYYNSNIIFCTVGGSPTGHLSKSTDFGVTWNKIDSITGSDEVPGLATTIFNPSIIYSTYIGTSHGGVRKSTNLGINWNTADSDRGAWGIDIAKDDPNLVVYGDQVYNRKIKISTDGGVTFFETQGALNTEIYALLAYDRKTIIAQSSGAFYKLNITYNNPIGIQPISNEVPKQFSLYQNYPNPFNPETKIRFEIPTVGQRHAFDTKLIIYNILGQEIATLVNEQLQPGVYEVAWNASDYPSGIYFYTLQTDNFYESKKMMLIK